MLYWALRLVGDTEIYGSFFIVCIIVGFLGVVFGGSVRSLLYSCKTNTAVSLVFAAAFGIATVLACYATQHGIINRLLLFGGGFFIAINSLVFALYLFKQYGFCKQSIMHSRRAFAIPFLILSLVFLLNLFCCQYPGVCSPDSIDQIGQCISGDFTNHHPFWHTIIIAACTRVGLSLLGDINVGVALYSTIQCIFMAASISYGTLTMRQVGLPRWTIVLCTAIFVLLPYHLIYSSTVWKNIPFSCCVLLFSLATYRVLKGVHDCRAAKALDYAILIMSCFGVALFQQNGWYALIGSVAFFVILLYGSQKRVLVSIGAAVLVVSFLLNHALLGYLGVAPIGQKQSISIPAQQIARVVVDSGIDDDDRAILQKYIDVDSIPQIYVPYISDNMKDAIDESYYASHKDEFLALWLRLGVANPKTYLEAWIDQTKGYWFGGYDYWITCQGVVENTVGVAQGGIESIRSLQSRYNDFLSNRKIYQPFVSIGLAVWLALALLAACIIMRRRNLCFIGVTALMVIATLLISTPVFSEFRYAYSLYLVLPFFMFLYMSKDDNDGWAANEAVNAFSGESPC